MNDACGSESRRLRASPSIKSYWLRCASSAITTMFRRSGRSGALPPLLVHEKTSFNLFETWRSIWRQTK